MTNLNDASYHLANLIEQEALSLKVEMDELNGIRIFTVGNIQGCLININVFLSLQFHHKPLSSHLSIFNIFRIIMILLSPMECLEQIT